MLLWCHVQDLSTDRILKEIRRVTHVDHFRIDVEVFDGPGCPVGQRMTTGVRRVVVDIGCGETLGALAAAVEARVRGHIRLYRLAAAAPHSSDFGKGDMSALDHERYAAAVAATKPSRPPSVSGNLALLFSPHCLPLPVRVLRRWIYLHLLVCVCLAPPTYLPQP